MEVINVSACPNVLGYTDVVKYKVQSPKGVTIALVGNENLQSPFLYDEAMDEYVVSYRWSYHNATGYFYGAGGLLHRHIAKLGNFEGLDNNALSVDHINWYKSDNRVENLRMATQSEQNSNRDTRRDKLPPHQTLIDACITELPRHVRWDKTEHKFVIEKHHVLLHLVDLGLRSKPTMSGTKKKSLSILEKYEDIVTRLAMLDAQDTNTERRAFREKRDVLKKEYEDIVVCINTYKSSNSLFL
jgi:hypothetical protein